MDLDDFEAQGAHSSVGVLWADHDPAAAVEELDRVWYSRAGRSARWMDLLGDYCGNELFVIDGKREGTIRISIALTVSQGRHCSSTFLTISSLLSDEMIVR
jgi:hypothetical protein